MDKTIAGVFRAYELKEKEMLEFLIKRVENVGISIARNVMFIEKEDFDIKGEYEKSAQRAMNMRKN